MALNSATALPEYWKELRVARNYQARCNEDIEAIKTECAATHGAIINHVTECQECYPRVVDRMLKRFHDDPDHEWFFQRKAFVVGLEGLFTQVKHMELDLESVEKSVDHEKEAWYRGILRRHSQFLCDSERGVSSEGLKAALEDSDRSLDELVAMVWKSIGSPDDWEFRLDRFVEKLSRVHTAAELKALYVQEFFKDHTTGETLTGAEKYLEEYLASPSTNLGPIIDKIVAAKKEEKGLQTQRDKHQARLDELRRAKTAFEQAKALSKAQQHSAAQASAVGEHLYDLPPCLICGHAVDPKEVLACTSCQVECQIGGERKMTVYCSEECCERGKEAHDDIEHDCEALDHCVREGEEDDEMEDDTNGPVACDECLREKRVTIFCSPRCAFQNLRPHWESRHGARIQSDDAQGSVTPMHEVYEKTMKEINPGVAYSLQ